MFQSPLWNNLAPKESQRSHRRSFIIAFESNWTLRTPQSKLLLTVVFVFQSRNSKLPMRRFRSSVSMQEAEITHASLFIYIYIMWHATSTDHASSPCWTIWKRPFGVCQLTIENRVPWSMICYELFRVSLP